MSGKKKPEYVEGRKAFENFENAMDALMKVPHSQIKAQLDEQKRQKAEKKRRRPPRAAAG
jgi:hypothetical protein